MAHIPFTPPTPPGGGTSDAAIGQILQIAADGNTVIADHGDTRVTSADFGNGLAQAFNDVQSGQTLRMRGFTATLVADLILASSKVGVNIIAEDVTIRRTPGTPYDVLLRVDGPETVLSGITVENLNGESNTSGAGYGIYLIGDKIRAYNIAAKRMRGTLADPIDRPHINNGNGLRINGDDVIVDGYFADDCAYSSLMLADANRCTVRNATIKDPNNRAVNIQGTTWMDWISLENFVGYNDVAGMLEAGCFTNCNIDGWLSRLTLHNFYMRNGDRFGAGYSYDTTDGLQMFKCHNIGTLDMEDVTLWHGANLTNGTANSFRHSGITEGHAIRRFLMTRCNFASQISFQQTDLITQIHLKECILGARFDMLGQDSASLILECYAKDFLADGCEFHLGPRRFAFDTLEGKMIESSTYRFVNNLFTSNRNVAGSRPSVFRGGGVAIPGRFYGDNNRYIQRGTAGAWDVGLQANDRLCVTTNAAGEMMFDPEVSISTPTGTGNNQMPMPWTGYTNATTANDPGTGYFPHVPPSSVHGATIRNVRYTRTAAANTVNAIRYWITESTPAKAISISAGDKADGQITSASHGFLVNDFVYFRIATPSPRLACTANISTNLFTATGHTFTAGQVVGFVAVDKGKLPRGGASANDSGIASETPYFVRDVTPGSTFKVSRWLNGTAIDLEVNALAPFQVYRWELPTHFGGTSATTAVFFNEFQRHRIAVAATSTFRVAPIFDGVAGSTYNIVDEGVPASVRVVGVKWMAYYD